MAYTRSWSNTTPAGSNLANTADDEIRNLRLDTYERMNTLLGGTQWNTDPVLDFTTTMSISLQWNSGTPTKVDSTSGILNFDATSGDASGSYIFPGITSSALKWAIGYVIPVGYTITKIQSHAYCVTAGSSTVAIAARKASAFGAATTMGTDAALTTGNGQTYDHAISAYPVVAGDTFWVYATMTATTTNINARWYGITVTYTRPSLAKGY